MVGVNIVAADTDAEARRLLTSLQQMFVALRRGRPGRLPPPRDGYEETLTAQEQAILASVLECSFVGSPTTVRDALAQFLVRTGADELIVASQIHEFAARARSYEIAAEIRGELARGGSGPH